MVSSNYRKQSPIVSPVHCQSHRYSVLQTAKINLMQSVRGKRVVDDFDLLLQLDNFSDEDMKVLIASSFPRKYPHSSKTNYQRSSEYQRDSVKHELIKTIIMRSYKETSDSVSPSNTLASKGRTIIASSVGGAGIGGAVAGIPGAIVGALLAGAFTFNTSRSKKE